VEHDFRPLYVVQKDSRKQLTELKKLCKEAEEVILATDEDREGESISWHLLEELKPKVPVHRIAFHEITREAVQEALANPREINDALVRAQETRRILDRLFGYELSPVLWRKVKSNLSAGRVQSVAVLLVVEREEERRAFKKAQYWDLEATLAAADREFMAELVTVDGLRVAQGKDFDPATGQLKNSGTEKVLWLDETAARQLAETLSDAACRWTVLRVEEKETRSRPNPPFTTSTLQQAASSAFGMSPQRTMRIAQQLYEGIDIGGGDREGLITYMRTDSVTLSERALRDASAVIRKMFGAEYHERRQYETRSKLAQEAHEAIRPTRFDRTPDRVAPYLEPDQLKLYQLIWTRAVASQMADA
ncbi:MAG TPA: type I DNA topoisomerase, partial [Candidatus Hydrogenedentes bacterium]|nr:type I DNA topoisomerase [Candidatus Hydrogenedentota bacterium]